MIIDMSCLVLSSGALLYRRDAGVSRSNWRALTMSLGTKASARVVI